MDSLFPNLQYLLLLVLVVPVASAGVVWAAGHAGAPTARRVAAYCAAMHLVLTVALGFLGWSAMSDRAKWIGRGAVMRFDPIAVVGAPDLTAGGREVGTGTSWTLLSLAPADGPRGIPPSEVQFFVGLDGLNLTLVVLASLMTFLAVLVSWESVTDRAGAYYAWVFLLQAGILGTFLALDIILFYVFFELTLIPTFFLIGRWGVGGGRRDAARKFFLYTLFGSLLTLVGIAGVVLTNPTPLNPYATTRGGNAPVYTALTNVPGAPGELQKAVPGPVTFSIPKLIVNHSSWSVATHWWVIHLEEKLRRPNLPPEQRQATERELADAKVEKDRYHSLQAWLFVALMAGFAVKIPVVPFHTWLPAAYAEAPLAVTMLLSALLAKLGTFGVLRLVLPLTPEAALAYGLPVVGALGAVGIVYAAFCAYAQRDLKLLVAYSSVSHLGFLVLGLFSFTPEGVAGAVLHMVNHGLTVGALFALLGFLAERYRTLDVDRFGGLWGRVPRYTFFVVVLSLAAVGLPGLNNFVSEMLMLAGLFDPRNTTVVGYGPGAVAAFGIFLTAWYMVTMLRRVFFGPAREPATAPAPAADLTTREFVTFGVLAGLCLALGLAPQPVLDVIRPDVDRYCELGDSGRYALGRVGAYRPDRPDRPRPPEEAAPPGPPAGRGMGGGMPPLPLPPSARQGPNPGGRPQPAPPAKKD